MTNSLRSKIKKLRHTNNISEEMSNELIDKLDGHNRELRNKIINEFSDKMIIMMPGHKQDILEIAEQMRKNA